MRCVEDQIKDNIGPYKGLSSGVRAGRGGGRGKVEKGEENTKLEKPKINKLKEQGMEKVCDRVHRTGRGEARQDG